MFVIILFIVDYVYVTLISYWQGSGGICQKSIKFKLISTKTCYGH